ncbi:hypothetical protein LWI28_005101 [Acer negundo]|uniref:MULE transposase domain-containing protein n=1 Tax=Acer negundo TaxID=4023 RepID=A0AAD5NT19_ACENE|nr:hypothetical protein LWI28_005101 [Acer negundo]
MRPVIAVDGTHLKGRFGENNLSWEWFLECLRGALGHIDDLVFISDRHASIEAGISKVFPYATHTTCCWHFGENMKKRFHRKDVADIMDSAARTYSKFNYNRHIEELHRLYKGVFEYVIAAGPHKWSRVHYPQRREQNLDFTSLCADYYKRETLIDAYSVPTMPVGHPSSWVLPSDIASRVVLNPKSKRQSGRPMEGRHASSSERTTTQSCRRCGQSGNNSRRCSNPPMVNEGPSISVPDEYRRKCGICHSSGHNKQTCPEKDSTVE